MNNYIDQWFYRKSRDSLNTLHSSWAANPSQTLPTPPQEWTTSSAPKHSPKRMKYSAPNILRLSRHAFGPETKDLISSLKENSCRMCMLSSIEKSIPGTLRLSNKKWGKARLTKIGLRLSRYRFRLMTVTIIVGPLLKREVLMCHHNSRKDIEGIAITYSKKAFRETISFPNHPNAKRQRVRTSRRPSKRIFG